MINLHNNTITTNKRKLYFLLTIPFLTLTNIPNIIFSYDNDVFATTVGSSRGNRVYFSKEEDDQLRRLVEANGTKNWSLIAEQMPGKDPEQCFHRWSVYLKHPATTKGSFTQEEDNRLRGLVEGKNTKERGFLVYYCRKNAWKKCKTMSL